MAKTNELSRRRFVASAASATVAAVALRGEASAAGPEKPKSDDTTTLTPYLLFDGTCGEAMQFYQSCLGGQLTLTKVKDSPAKAQMSPAQQDKVLNAHLSAGHMEISASDWLAPNQTPAPGNTVCMYLSGTNLPDLKKLFEKLSAGGKVTNPLQPTFFGAYGALNDRFGVRWMFAGKLPATGEQ